MTITLTNLIAQARYRANMENTQFVTDSEITDYVNSSIAELHDLLISSSESEYKVTSTTFVTTSTDTYALATVAADFYKLKGVDYQLSNDQWVTLRPFNFNERNRNHNITYNYLNQPDIRYRIVGNNFVFSHIPDSGKTIRLWYIPVAVKLVNGTDTLDDLNQFYEYVVTDTAIKMLLKEESDISVQMALKADLKKRIEAMSRNRDMGNPQSISDIYAERIQY